MLSAKCWRGWMMINLYTIQRVLYYIWCPGTIYLNKFSIECHAFFIHHQLIFVIWQSSPTTLDIRYTISSCVYLLIRIKFLMNRCSCYTTRQFWKWILTRRRKKKHEIILSQFSDQYRISWCRSKFSSSPQNYRKKKFN